VVTGLNLVCAILVVLGCAFNIGIAFWIRLLLRQEREVARLMDETYQTFKKLVDSFGEVVRQMPESVVGNLKVSIDCPVCHQPIIAEPGVPTQIPHAECRVGRPRSWNN